MKKLALLLAALGLLLLTSAQNTINLSFTAVNGNDYAKLDSIKIMNRTRGDETLLYYPDTSMVLHYETGIDEYNSEKEGFRVLQNYPNPMEEQTTVSLLVPEKDNVCMIVSDPSGRVINKSERVLERGIHSFRLRPAQGSLCFFTARWRGYNSSIKILQVPTEYCGKSPIEYIGSEAYSPTLKETSQIKDFSFSLGDTLLYIGYASGLQSGLLNVPEGRPDFIFQFATGIPCPGLDSVIYEEQCYHTVQIFSQCWLKENLNAGELLSGSLQMTDNGIIEKYCYDNDTNNCKTYGGLYLWGEVMNYSTQQGSQGICPPGWHLPTDEEWKILEGSVDSEYGIGHSEWDGGLKRGFDAGKNLKSLSGWSDDGNGTDLFGFTGFPGGYFSSLGHFDFLGQFSYWWTSTVNEDHGAWGKMIYYDDPRITRSNAAWFGEIKYGLSVRCLKNY